MLLPLLPIVIGVSTALLQQDSDVSLVKLLDGIELFLISLSLVAVTFLDLARSQLNWSGHVLLYFAIRVILFVFGVLNLIFLTLVYINNRVTSLDFDRELTVILAMGFLTIVFLITTLLQFYVNYVHSKVDIEGDQ